MSIKADIIQPLDALVHKLRDLGADGMTEEEMDLESAAYKAVRVLKHINNFVELHGNQSLTQNREWLYKDKVSQVDAVILVGDLLEELMEYAEMNELEGDEG